MRKQNLLNVLTLLFTNHSIHSFRFSFTAHITSKIIISTSVEDFHTTNIMLRKKSLSTSSSLHVYTKQILFLSIVIVSLSASAFSSSNNHQFPSKSKLNSPSTSLRNSVPLKYTSQTSLHAAKDVNMMPEPSPNKNSIITNSNNKKIESPSALGVSTAGNLPVRGGGFAHLSKVRDAIFPIYGKNEVTKFLLLGMMKFFIIFVLTLTRDTKDTLIVTQCGAEAIAFLKVSIIFICFKGYHRV